MEAKELKSMECPFNKGTLYSIRNHVVLKNAEVDEFEGYFLKEYPWFYLFETELGYKTTIAKVDCMSKRYNIKEAKNEEIQ